MTEIIASIICYLMLGVFVASIFHRMLAKTPNPPDPATTGLFVIVWPAMILGAVVWFLIWVGLGLLSAIGWVVKKFVEMLEPKCHQI